MQQPPKQVQRSKTYRHDPTTRAPDDQRHQQQDQELTFYPAYCFPASETYTKWIKLTGNDIHSTLKPHGKYTDVTTDGRERGGLLLFCLNHPIQFVQVVGVVVVFEDYLEKLWLFTVDDSSGATIDICCPKPQNKDNEKGVTLGAHRNKASIPQNDVQNDGGKPQDPDVVAQRALHATIARLDIGTVVQAKGVITTFRSVRQLHLIRLFIVPTTSDELRLISSRSQFFSSTLSRPWELSSRKQKALLQEAQGEHEGKNQRERKRRERTQMLKEREERHARRIRREYEREEEERKKGADQARLAAEKMPAHSLPSRSPLLWRAYQVIQTPNDILVEKLGLDIPPSPLLTLEAVSSREVQVTWKHVEPSSSVSEYHVEVNGRVVGTTRKTETGAVISNLISGTKYDIRIFCVSNGNFQTPSAPLRIRTPHDSSASSQDGSSDATPTVRAISLRNPLIVTPASAPAMIRELSGGQPLGRRGTTGRRPSPANHVSDSQQAQEAAARAGEDEVDGDLADLSATFQRIQQETEAIEAQTEEEEIEYQTQLKELEARRDDLKQHLKERDEVSNDLRKQVHKAETANRTAQNERTKKERILAQKESERRKRKDEIAKWKDQIVTMKEEMAGIETQRSAIERRTQTELREIRKKIEEEQKEVAMLEEDNKEKARNIKALEEERQQLNVEDETDESREADRLQRERTARWRARYDALNQQYSRLWAELQFTNQQANYTREQITAIQNRRANSIAFAPMAPLDMDAVRRGLRPVRRPRHPGSHGSSISSPRGPFVGPEPFQAAPQYTSVPNASPTIIGPSYFNPQNGMTLVLPHDISTSTGDDLEPVSSIPMSPRADSLLPADLLGDESADELADTEALDLPPANPEAGTMPFPTVGSPTLQEHPRHAGTPSAGSSSSRSFSSPLQTSAPVPVPVIEAEGKSSSSEENEEDVVLQQPPKPKYSMASMSSMFGLSRQRGKTLADQPPLLGSLKAGQSQSFPRNMDEFDPTSQPRRRLSYGGNWAFPGTLLRSSGAADEKDQENSRLGASRRPFLFPGFGKSATATASYDPFAARSGSFDPGLRGDTSSPRPSSTYSFDKMPRPSMESQFRAWASEKPTIRNSPLAPDWGSLHSFSRSHSRRPSVVYGSTSNLSLPHGDEEVVEDRKPPRPLQAPIGTRPASSQQNATPRLNPAAPSFTMFFGKKGEKIKEKEKSRAKDSKERVGDLETNSPPESRKSRDTNSIAATISTIESEPLDRTMSATSGQISIDSTPVKPTFISKITRKASSNKFGSWKDKGGGLFSRKDPTAPNGENEEEQGSSEYLGKSMESIATTPGTDDRKSTRSGLSNWSFMRKSKKGTKEDLTASEISENSERTSEVGDARDEDDG